MADGESAFRSLLKRDRMIVFAALTIITILAWLYLWLTAAQMRAEMGQMVPDMPGMAMPGLMPTFARWSSARAFSQFAMWAVMMVGMMTPSVAPVVLIYARVVEQTAARGAKLAAPIWFAAGYLLTWIGFAFLATVAQFGLERTALLTPALASANRYFGGAVLIVAGAYQWSPLKEGCLANCRAPLAFIQSHGGFKPGIVASVRLGALHGAYCIGCCWALMAVLFVAGIMNLAWIATIMVLVLLEKLAPYGRWTARITGAGAVVAGAWMFASG